MPDCVSLRDLRIKAGDHELVRGVGLRIRAGHLTALVGRSGSGKSLTARSLLGLVEIEPGVVSADLEIVRGEQRLRPYDGLGAGRRRARDRAFAQVRGSMIGYLPQDCRAALDPLARVGAQVSVAARLAGRPPDPLPWLLQAQLPEPERVASLYPHELSGGMAQRVVIAQALARGSSFLLADEPTSALDPTVQASVLRALRALVDAGLGLLLITHDLRVLPGLADEIVLLHGGQVAETCTPQDLRAGSLRSEAGMRLVEATARIAGGVLG